MIKGKEESVTKEEIIKALEDLTQEPGFLYSLAVVLRHDLFLNPEESADINWRERLSFQEVSFLVGLMVKCKIDISIIPTEDIFKEQGAKLNMLFKKLHEAYNIPLFEELTKQAEKKKTSKEEEKSYQEFFGDGERMVEPIFYDGSGAYDFQYWEFARKKYKEDEAWIQDNKGITVSKMADISERLKRLCEEKRLDLQNVKTFDDLCKTSLSIFCFSRKDLNTFDEDTVTKFVNTFSITPGRVNEVFDSVGAYNVVDSHPIVVLAEDLYFIPVDFNIAQSIYESPFYWMSSDSQYSDIALKHRGDATENIAHEMLESVFGKENVYKNVKVYKNKKVLITDIDVLAIAGNKAIVVQTKSKKLTKLSRMGDEGKLKKDFKEAIQIAYDQGLACRAAVINKTNILITDNGTELYLNELIDDAYIICLTTDHYPAVTHQVDFYLKKGHDDPDPLAMSIFDLDILVFYLKDPFEFLYYLRQRIKLSTNFIAGSEISFLGYHLSQKLFLPPKVDGVGIDEGFAQLIDANYPAMRGYIPKTSAVEKLRNKWRNEQFKQLIAQIKATGHPGFTDAIFFMYDLSGKSADDLIRLMKKTKQKTLQDGQAHDFSSGYGNGKSGITFLCIPDTQEKLGSRLMTLAVARKYKTKADVWIGFGSIANSPNIVDVIAFDKQPWEKNMELEELARVYLKTGKALNGEGGRIGRNNPCVCGSGKKFKNCCGK
jgi:hypothetical protein